ncbi:MAG: PilZ domain-containing protein [Solirubrobacteraceae bacterium]|nr:PilZ domain-containing protein [Solirubrobacteraceae bacterium]
MRMTCDLTLSRPRGGPVDGRTVDVSGAGMLVETERPLAVDELVAFVVEPTTGVRMSGDARVMRCDRPGVYALRLEHPADELLDQFERLVLAGTARA